MYQTILEESLNTSNTSTFQENMTVKLLFWRYASQEEEKEVFFFF